MALSSFLFHRQKLRYCGNSGILFRASCFVSSLVLTCVSDMQSMGRASVSRAVVLLVGSWIASRASVRASGHQRDRVHGFCNGPEEYDAVCTPSGYLTWRATE